jgi:Tol biopolymer transport system component
MSSQVRLHRRARFDFKRFSALVFAAALAVRFAILIPLWAHSDEPEGKFLLTVPHQVGEKYELAIVNLRGQIIGKVLESDQPLLEPAWLPDGRRLAYVTVDAGQPQIFVAGADGSAAANLTKSEFLERNPAWSPDGSQIAWTRVEQNEHSIWVVQQDGSQSKRISDSSVMCSNPSWSPNHKLIAYSTQRPSEPNFRLWQMNADGSDPRELFKQLLIRTVYPQWSPDGKQILFGGPGSGGSVQLCVCNADGEGFSQLTHDNKQCSFASWSPDGQYIAYVAFERWPGGYSAWGPNADTNCPAGDLMLYDTLTGENRTLISGALPMYGPRPSWKPHD